MSITFRELIGRGWAFPITLDSRGAVALTNEENELIQAVYVILSTAPGERVMRPDFGCRIHEYLFDPANAATAAAVEEAVREALGRWEPRILLNEVTVTPSPETFGMLMIALRFTVKATREETSLVYPFYLMQ